MTTERPNVVLLTIDALRADHCSCYGYDRETTPTLDRLASENVRFSNAYSVSTHTREAIPGLLTGRYPSECVTDEYELAAETVATQLKNSAYTTGAFHSNPFVSRAYGFGHDFDTFDDDLYLSQHKLVALAQRMLDKLRNRHYARAEEISERTLKWIDSTEEPFFLWAHYMDPHGPYCAPDEYQKVFHDERVRTGDAQDLYWRAAAEDPESVTDAERREMLNCYDEEIRYVDDQIGAFLDALEARGLLENSLVILTADHGDLFGEHGLYGHPRRLHEELLRVPMIVLRDGVPEVDVEAPVSILDVAPTALDAAGLGVEEFPGESLLEIASTAGAYRDRVVVSEVRGEPRHDEGRLRRVQADSREAWARIERDVESGDIVKREPAESPLIDVLREHSDASSTSEPERGGSESMSSDIERRLEALGYKER